MKFILSTLVIVGVIMIHSVQASEFYDYDAKAVDLLNKVFSSCPIQFIQAMKGADRVGKVSYSSDRPGEWITLTTVTGGSWGGPQIREIATLKISRLYRHNTTPDNPVQFDVHCALGKPEN